MSATFRKRMEDLHVAVPKELPDETYRVLHNSFVDIFKMRRSIEGVDALVEQSTKAILESREMLKYLQSAGF